MYSKAYAALFKGWELFRHSFLMVFNNLGAAARISVPWILVSAILIGLWMVFIRQLMNTGVATLQILGVLGLFAILIGLSVIGSIIAIKWHRFVLLGEMPQGYLSGWRDLNYRTYTIQVFKILFFMVVLSYFANTLVTLVFFGEGQFFSGLVMSLILTFVFLRLAIGLPAIALKGKRLGPAQSWKMSKDFREVLFVTALLMTLLNSTIEFLSMLIPGPSFVSLVPLSFAIVLVWFSMMAGVSLLTTLYGVYVEKRSI